ncbi:MAG: thymidylate synthase, partial [bacterium]|nr:thymidylate synthase [bacterium]
MSKFDKEYLKLCEEILNCGVLVKNRTGIDSIKIPSYSFHFDLCDEFPMLTTKQVFYKNAITEMLWIYQAQSNDVRWL